MLEAIASGTYLTATPMAVEFLSVAIREKLLLWRNGRGSGGARTTRA